MPVVKPATKGSDPALRGEWDPEVNQRLRALTWYLAGLCKQTERHLAGRHEALTVWFTQKPRALTQYLTRLKGGLTQWLTREALKP